MMGAHRALGMPVHACQMCRGTVAGRSKAGPRARADDRARWCRALVTRFVVHDAWFLESAGIKITGRQTHFRVLVRHDGGAADEPNLTAS